MFCQDWHCHRHISARNVVTKTIVNSTTEYVVWFTVFGSNIYLIAGKHFGVCS
jgi:hypothetical protein